MHTKTQWMMVASLVAAAMTACIVDETNTSSPSCFQGCELAADRLACVAACEGTTDAGTGADGGGADARDPDGSLGEDTALDGGDAEVPDDTTPSDIDTGEADGSDDVDASDVEDDTTPVLVPPDIVTLLSCQDTFACLLQSAVLDDTGEACTATALPVTVEPAAAALACAQAAGCIDPDFPDFPGALVCARSACPGEYDACGFDVPVFDGCGAIADCLATCGKRDAACRTACYGTSAESNAVANGYDDCEARCFGQSEGQATCVFQACQVIGDACYGTSRPSDWTCDTTLACVSACVGDSTCVATCQDLNTNRRSQLALRSVEECAGLSGCTTGDAELDNLCILESCGTALGYCEGE
jgi:hypothetical protein